MSSEEPSNAQGDASARNVVVWSGLVLLCAVAAAGWWASRTLTLPRELREPKDASTPDGIEPAGAAGAESAAGMAGAVFVRVVDAIDGTPLEGIEVELISEEPVRRRFGRSRSDARGELRFQGVFAPLALAHVRRSERFAAALSIARGDVGFERKALLRLGGGGSISGRVVDDGGAPVEGAALFLPDTSPWPDPAQSMLLAGRSARDGSYRIDRVVDLPRLITSRAEGIFAAAWSEVIVEARGSGGSVRGAISVLPCAQSLAADLVLPRPPTLNGRVLDFARRPLSGALVSVNPERLRLPQVNLHVVDPPAVAQGVADLPGSERFELLPGEALTADDGSFSLVGASPRASALVALGDGRLEEFPTGPWIPGGRVEGLEFVLADREVFRVRLFDAEGRPILGAPPSFGAAPASADDLSNARVAPLGGMSMAAWTGSRVELFAELSDGRELRVQCAPSGEGVFAFALATPLTAIERLSITAPGYKPRIRECHGRLRQESVVANERLEQLDALELSIERVGELEDPPGCEPQDVQVRACALEPESIGNADPSQPRPACCGQGMIAQMRMVGRERRIVMPMLGDRPFWLTVRTSRGRRAEEFSAGPFRTGDGLQRLEIPALAPGPSPFDGPVPVAARSDPRAVGSTLTASLCVFDARSTAVLAGAEVWVACDPLGREAWLGRTWTADADGCATLDGLFDGTWTFVVGATGHRAFMLGPLEVRSVDSAGPELDLGPVRLEPLD